MKKEFEIAKNCLDTNPRLSIVILDNLVEITLFNLIQGNAMFDYMEKDENAKSRINLYTHFDKKIKYAVKKKYIDQSTSDLLLIFHKIRNKIYHSNQEINIGSCLAKFYFKIVNEIYFNELNSCYRVSRTNEISIYLKNDLESRFKKLREDIAESCEGTRNFSSLESNDDEINDSLDHVFSNYGEHVIEKSNLDKIIKEKYINTYIDNEVAFNSFFQIKDLYDWEKIVKKFKWNDDLKSLTKWNEQDNLMLHIEEIIATYVNIAC